MYLKEITNQSWNVSTELKVTTIETGGLAVIEQELSILRLREGIKNPDKPEIQINCSDQTGITELSKSEYFTLTHIEVSSHERNPEFIISIKGELDVNGLTIRKKKPQYSEEEKQKRSERAKINLKRQ